VNAVWATLGGMIWFALLRLRDIVRYMRLCLMANMGVQIDSIRSILAAAMYGRVTPIISLINLLARIRFGGRNSWRRLEHYTSPPQLRLPATAGLRFCRMVAVRRLRLTLLMVMHQVSLLRMPTANRS
jgi:hypothetical protein